MGKSKLYISTLTLMLVLSFGLSGFAYADSKTAKRHMERGAAAMEMAESQADYLDAVAEFSLAVKQAPDWADAWFNLGTAQELAEKYQAAIKSFKTYLEKTPKAADRETVEARIFRLEYKMEKTQKRGAAERPAAVSSERLSGYWQKVSLWNTFDTAGGKPWREGRSWFDLGRSASANVQVQGVSIEIKVQLAGATRIYKGNINGNRITGRMDESGTRCGSRTNVDFQGAVWPEDNVILIIAPGFCDGYGNLRNDNYRSSHLLQR